VPAPTRLALPSTPLSGLPALEATPVATLRALVDTFGRRARLEERHAVPGGRRGGPASDPVPDAEVGVNPGSDHVVGQRRAPWDVASPAARALAEAATDAAAPAVRAAVSGSSSGLVLHRRTCWLHEGRSEDHDADREQFAVFHQGPPGAMEPTWMACSRHEGGMFRAWSGVAGHRDATGGPARDPVAFVADGGEGRSPRGGRASSAAPYRAPRPKRRASATRGARTRRRCASTGSVAFPWAASMVAAMFARRRR
jgi:hypothetical protein